MSGPLSLRERVRVRGRYPGPTRSRGPSPRPSPGGLTFTHWFTAYVHGIQHAAYDHVAEPSESPPERLDARFAVTLAAQESAQPSDRAHRLAKAGGDFPAPPRRPRRPTEDLPLRRAQYALTGLIR